MYRSLFSLLSLSFVACQDVTKNSDIEQEQETQKVDTEEQAEETQEEVQEEPESQEPELPETETEPEPEPEEQVKASLICSSSSFYDYNFDGEQRVLRINLVQDGELLKLHANKGAIHPVYGDTFHEAVFEMEGSIGDEVLTLMIDSDHEVFDVDDAFNGTMNADLIRLEHGDQIFYQGNFNQFGCGGYGANGNSVTCWQPDIEPEFSYNSLNGVCLNEQNEVGFNPWTVEMIRETQDGQCASLSNLDLNEQDYDTPNLTWDLRGSDLNYAMVSYATLIMFVWKGLS